MRGRLRPSLHAFRICQGKRALANPPSDRVEGDATPTVLLEGLKLPVVVGNGKGGRGPRIISDRSDGLTAQSVSCAMPDAQAVKHRARPPRQEALGRQKIVGVNLVIAALDVDDHELAGIIALNALANLLRVEFFAAAFDILG
jgi:hypothetical protein